MADGVDRCWRSPEDAVHEASHRVSTVGACQLDPLGDGHPGRRRRSVAPHRWRERSSARSIWASPVTGYWGADRLDPGVDLVAMRDDRGDQLAGQLGRASRRARSRPDGARGSPSAVRWPKSASKTAASARRRPVAPIRGLRGQPPTPSTMTVTALRGRGRAGARRSPPTAVRTCAGERPERLAGPGDDAQADEDPVVARRGRGPPGRRASAARPGRRGRRERRPGPRTRRGGRARRSRPRPTVSSGPLTTPASGGLARRPVAAARRSARPRRLVRDRSVGERLGDQLRDARPGRRRGDLAARSRSSAACARPWVMITVPLTPSSGEPPALLVVEDRRGSGRCRAASGGTRAGPRSDAPELRRATGRR